MKVNKQSDFSTALEESISRCQNIISEDLKLPLLGIAVSVPSIYYEEEDAVNCDLIPGLKGVHLKKLLSDALDIKNVIIIHDVCANASLEYQLADSDSLYYLYAGDGLGSAYVRHGEVFQGDVYAAGEIGQCLIEFDDAEQYYEHILSSAGLCRLLGISAREELEGLLGSYPDLPDNQMKAIAEITNLAAGILYNICWLLNPGTIVIDSSIPMLAELIHDAALKKCERLAQSPIYNTVRITLPKEKKHYSMSGCVNPLVNNWIEEILGKI